MLKKIDHKPDEGQMVNIKLASLLCSIEGLVDAIGMISVNLNVLKHLLFVPFYLLFGHTL